MAKKKGIKIRRAKLEDRKLAMKLWREYLEDEKLAAGGVVPPTDHNMEVFERIFDAYVSGEHQGVVLLHAEDAILIWGDPGGQLFETPLGRSAQGWGVYVREKFRGKGVSVALRRKASNILKTMGFDSVVGNVDPDNEAAFKAVESFGFKSSGLIVHYNLREN